MRTDESRESTWVPCPHCGKKTRTKVYPETVLVNFPLYCPKCKREMCVNIVRMKMMKATPEWCEALRKNAPDSIIVNARLRTVWMKAATTRFGMWISI